MKKGQTNNPNGRPPLEKTEKRRMVSLRLKPKTIDKLKQAANNLGCSQSDLIEGLVNELPG